MSTNGNSKFRDDQIPALARVATRAEYKKAIRAGSVLVYRNGQLLKIENGDRSVIKMLEPRVRIPKGTKIKIKPETV